MTGSDLIVVAPWDHLRCRRGRRVRPAALPAPGIPAAGGADLPAVPRSDRPRRFAARGAARPGRRPGRGGAPGAATACHGPRRPPAILTHRKHNGPRRARKPRGRSAGPVGRPTRPAVAGDPGVPLAGPAGGGHRAVAGLSRRRRGPGRPRRRRRPAEGPGLPLRRTVTARRKLADVEDALAQCGSAIPATLLTLVPEARYCLRCADEPDEPAPARRPAVAGRGHV